MTCLHVAEIKGKELALRRSGWPEGGNLEVRGKSFERYGRRRDAAG
jgi:hypothetical protein